jgi:hypothetical protein
MVDKLKPIAVIKKFFFENPITEGVPKIELKDLAAQLKQLTPADKVELAEGAAKELGVEVDWSTTQ